VSCASAQTWGSSVRSRPGSLIFRGARPSAGRVHRKALRDQHRQPALPEVGSRHGRVYASRSGSGAERPVHQWTSTSPGGKLRAARLTLGARLGGKIGSDTLPFYTPASGRIPADVGLRTARSVGAAAVRGAVYTYKLAEFAPRGGCTSAAPQRSQREPAPHSGQSQGVSIGIAVLRRQSDRTAGLDVRSCRLQVGVSTRVSGAAALSRIALMAPTRASDEARAKLAELAVVLARLGEAERRCAAPHGEGTPEP